jgi:hypothetical protein
MTGRTIAARTNLPCHRSRPLPATPIADLDVPDLGDVVAGRLLAAGFTAMGYAIETTGPTVRLVLRAGAALRERLQLAWGSMVGLDCALDGDDAIRIGARGEWSSPDYGAVFGG